MTPSLLTIGLATFVSEDAACIATGVLVANGDIELIPGVLACLAGISVGDLLLFLSGRVVGRKSTERWIGEARLNQATAWIERRGLMVVLVSRFTPGLRLPTYVAAGLVRARVWRLTLYFLIASAMWTPLLVAGTAIIGESALRSALGYRSRVAALAVAAVLVFAAMRLRDFETRRRLWGFAQRKIRWEFWPAWAVYLPLVPYFLYLAARFRSATLFTLANPGIPSGGLTGESKSAILAHLNRIEGAVPEYQVLRAGDRASSVAFPVVLKPDQGERGAGVSIIRNQRDLTQALQAAAGLSILQRYVEGEEFGIYYVRYPHEPRGRILSVTHKRFPYVTGDGNMSLRHLILRDPRAVCLADAYFAASKRPLDSIPAPGTRVQLVEIGSHCRGAIFEDGSSLITPELTSRIDQISQAHPGFHLGRYDVRAASGDALSRGEFKVIELNGVAAEATHVYDPKISLAEAYRTMARHWRMAFEVGATYRAQGLVPMTVAEVLRLVFARGSASAGAEQRPDYRQLSAVHHD